MGSEFVVEKFSAEILSKLASLRESGTFCDVILEADSSSKVKSEPTSATTIRAHKVVLAAASPFFRETLSSDSYTGQTTTKQIRIVVDDIDGETLRVLVDYIGRLDINDKNVRALFGAAEILQLHSVRSECSRYLIEHLSISNCMETVALAKAHNCTELGDAAVSFTEQHFGTMIEEKTSDIPENWYRRRQAPHSQKIMIAGGEPERSSFLADVNIYDPYSRQWTSAAPLLQPRRFFDMATVGDSIYAVGGLGTYGDLRSVEIYNSHGNSWRAGPEMQCCRSCLGVTTLNGTIFAAGGLDDREAIREAEMLDPRQGEWISLPSMLNRRHDFVLVAVSGLLYAAGCDYESQNPISVEVYDPRACRWAIAQPMLKIRYDAGATVLRDQIVVTGGSDKSLEVLSSAEMLTDNGWTFLPEMSVPRKGHGIVNVDGSLFAFGGRNRDGYLSCVEFLDFYLDQWEMLQVEMPQKNANFGITLLP